MKRETNMVPKSLFSMVTALWFTKSSILPGLGFFLLYKEARQRTRREGPRGPNGSAPRGQKVGPCGAPSLEPHGPPGLRLLPRVLLFHKSFYSTFPQIYFQSFLHKKDRKRFSAKNSVSSGSFYPNVGSISNKTSSKVIGKVNAYEMHQ
jgi:hypothetical protein